MTVSHLRHLTFGAAAAALMLPLAAAAQNGPPPGPPIAEIAGALGVSEQLMETCMPRPAEGARPAQGTRPERPDPATIAKCVQAKEPGITQQAVAQALEAHQPERPMRSN